MSTAPPNSLTRITRPHRIGWQWVDIDIGMPDQRNSLLDSIGPDEAVALRGAVLIGGYGEGEDWHGVRMRGLWLMDT